MASKSPVATLRTLSRHARPQCACQRARISARTTTQSSQFSTTTSRKQQAQEVEAAQRPRWAVTPERMKAPFQPARIKNPAKAFQVNEDPAKLDRMYNTFLGRGGDSLLTEEIKWMAVTHKSFDQGRRGFNDRLALFGRKILELHTTLDLLNKPIPASLQTQTAEGVEGEGERVPFKHPALEGLTNLDNSSVSAILHKSRIAQLAADVGIRDVTRWKPRNPANLEGSGLEVVMTTSLFAIIGAIALQKGGEVAAQIARERVIKPLSVQ